MSKREEEKKTTRKSLWLWSATIAILVIAIGFFVYLFFCSSYKEDIDSNVFVVTLTALIGLLGVTFQIIASKQSDAERRLHEIKINHRNTISQIKMKGYDAKKAIYDQLLKPFTNIVIATIKQEKINMQKNMEGIVKAGIDIHLLGSDETCKIWDEWRALSFKSVRDKESNEKAGLVTMALYPKLILSIRRDLGHPYTELNEIDILRSFIKDVDEYKDIFQIFVECETIKEALEVIKERNLTLPGESHG
jgi:hypothetical protein